MTHISDWHDATYVAHRMRDCDRREIGAGLRSWADFDQQLKLHAEHAVLFHVARHNTAPVAVVTAIEFAPTTVMLSLFATEEWPLVVRPLMRWALRTAKPFLLERNYRRAEARSLEGHDDAHHFLRRLGFAHECALPDFGVNGETFHQFAWRISDHVL